MFSTLDHEMMLRALELAQLGRYSTDPNPCVGCVVTRDGAIVGEGFHARAGEAHAEPLALQAAGERARGGTVYVTLEPHCFHGKTPPCTDALIRAGVQRVVCATLDPNPRVAGAGVRQLQEAGIEVQVGLLEESARALNLGFEKRMRSGMPRITVKIAASLDGRVALASGASRWITGPQARADVQRLRARSSAVVTGIGTVLADDPLLTVRDAGLQLRGRQPMRVVLDSKLRIPRNARLLEAPGPVLLVTAASNEPERSGYGAAEIIALPAAEHAHVDLEGLWRELARRQANEVLIEAGPALSTRVIEEGWCDELILYVAPKLLGSTALPMLQLPALERLQDAVELTLVEATPIGSDLRLTLHPKPKQSRRSAQT